MQTHNESNANVLHGQSDGNASKDSKVKKRKEKKILSNSQQANRENIEVQSVIDFYNESCTAMPIVEILTDSRKKAIKMRIKEHGLNNIKMMLKNAATAPFLNGDNDNGWTANFDWLFKPANFVKVFEGNYLNSKKDGFKTDQKCKVSNVENTATEVVRGISSRMEEADRIYVAKTTRTAN